MKWLLVVLLGIGLGCGGVRVNGNIVFRHNPAEHFTTLMSDGTKQSFSFPEGWAIDCNNAKGFRVSSPGHVKPSLLYAEGVCEYGFPAKCPDNQDCI